MRYQYLIIHAKLSQFFFFVTNFFKNFYFLFFIFLFLFLFYDVSLNIIVYDTLLRLHVSSLQWGFMDGRCIQW